MKKSSKKEITEHGNCGRTWWYGLRFFRGPGECILPACHSMVSENLTGITNEDIRRKMESFIKASDKRMKLVYKTVIEPQLDNLISILKKK